MKGKIFSSEEKAQKRAEAAKTLAEKQEKAAKRMAERKRMAPKNTDHMDTDHHEGSPMEEDSDEEAEKGGKRVDKLFQPLFSGEVAQRGDYLGGWGFENIARISEGVMERGVSNIIGKLSKKDIKEALAAITVDEAPKHPRSNDHLETSKTIAAARKLIDQGVTCADIARMTGALAILDTTMESPEEGMFTHFDQQLDMMLGREPRHPPIPRELNEAHAVVATIGRMLMKLQGRKVTEFRGPMDENGQAIDGRYLITDFHGPMDENGQAIDADRWTGLNASAAKRYLGVTRLDLDHINAVHAEECVGLLESNSMEKMVEITAALRVAQKFHVTEHERKFSVWC